MKSAFFLLLTLLMTLAFARAQEVSDEGEIPQPATQGRT